jgi:hypothetical protein
MKSLKKYSLAAIVIIAIMFTAVKCTKKNETLNLASTSTTTNTDTLYCVKGVANLNAISGNSLATAWNGSLDNAWSNAPALTVSAVVPDLGNNTFTGFIGNTTSVTMQSMYDASNIYFLVQWNAAKPFVASSPWYFNTTTKLWAQMTAAPVWDANGVEVSPPFVQDQFTMIFNIANSCAAFVTGGCFGACHVNTPNLVMDTATGAITSMPVYGGSMYTNGPSEKLDCWRARLLQVLNCNQANDTYLDWGNGAIDANEIHNDPQLLTTDGGKSNLQLLSGQKVPIYVNKSGYKNGAIMVGDTAAGGPCLRVVAVSAAGVLTLSDGSSIDPTTDLSYQQNGTGSNMTLGANCIPGSIVGSYTGSRGDVTANAYWTGSGWKMLLKRALNTGYAFEQDVDFSSLADQPFGIGVMFNGADNEHAIVSGLTLHFNK